MRIFITGAGGFVGINLVSFLVDQGHTVAVSSSAKNNLADILKTKTYHVNFYDGIDVLSFDDLKRDMKLFKPDAVVHLAAYGNSPAHDDERRIVQTNLVGAYNILAATKMLRVRQVVMVGSSSEYGVIDKMSPSSLPEPNTMYAASKVGATMLSQAFSNLYGQSVVILRPFTLFGEREASSRLIPTLVRNMMQGKKITLAINGVHDWVFVEDFCRMIEWYSTDNNHYPGQVFNFGSGVQTTNLDIMKMVSQIMGKDNYSYESISLDTIRPHDPYYRWVSHRKSIFCTTPLIDGIKKEVTYFRKKYERL